MPATPRFQIRYLDRSEGDPKYPPFRDLVLTDFDGVLIPGQRSLTLTMTALEIPRVTVELYVDGSDIVMACDQPARQAAAVRGGPGFDPETELVQVADQNRIFLRAEDKP